MPSGNRKRQGPSRTAGGDRDLAQIGALVADRARCRMLLALADGRALSAARLAAEGEVSPATASSHLSKLTAGGLLRVEAARRRRYYQLADPEVATLIEALERLAPTLPVSSLGQSQQARAWHPWRVEHLDLLALAGFFPVAMLLSDDVSQAGLWLAAVCLGWLFSRMLGAAFGAWRMPELRPSISSRWLGLAILILLLVRIGSVARGNILDVGQASSLGAWRLLHGLHLYGALSWLGPGGLRVYRPDSYGPFAYYAYIPFVALFPPAPALVGTLLPAACFDALTLAGLYTVGPGCLQP